MPLKEVMNLTCSFSGSLSGRGKQMLADDSNNCGSISLEKTAKSVSVFWDEQSKSNILSTFKMKNSQVKPLN